MPAYNALLLCQWLPAFPFFSLLALLSLLTVMVALGCACFPSLFSQLSIPVKISRFSTTTSSCPLRRFSLLALLHHLDNQISWSLTAYEVAPDFFEDFALFNRWEQASARYRVFLSINSPCVLLYYYFITMYAL